jgi:hypothetical protein
MTGRNADQVLAAKEDNAKDHNVRDGRWKTRLAGRYEGGLRKNRKGATEETGCRSILGRITAGDNVKRVVPETPTKNVEQRSQGAPEKACPVRRSPSTSKEW